MVGKAGNPVNPATPENAEIEEIYHFHSGANLKKCIFWNKGNPVENTFFLSCLFFAVKSTKLIPCLSLFWAVISIWIKINTATRCPLIRILAAKGNHFCSIFIRSKDKLKTSCKKRKYDLAQIFLDLKKHPVNEAFGKVHFFIKTNKKYQDFVFRKMISSMELGNSKVQR